jgi:sensor histidine kinase YesM
MEIEYTTKVKLMILIFIGKVVIQTTLVAFFKKINWKLLIQKYIYSVILLSIYDLRSVCDDLRSVC